MSLSTRNADILRRHEAGELYPDIARHYGITRERVRQIVAAHGGRARSAGNAEQRASLHAKIAEALETRWLTSQQASDEFGVSRAVIWKIARERGIEIERREFADEMRLMFLAAKVRAGESIRSVAADQSEEKRLYYYCELKGIKSKHGPHRDLSERASLLAQWRDEGLTWEECSKRLAEVDGREYGSITAYIWAKNHAPELIGSRDGRKRAPKRAPKPARAPAQIEIKENIRDTALANRGKASASQIAAVLGVSRNSIIGHWYRSRTAGAS